MRYTLNKPASAALSVEYSLLGLLSERPMHGYELHQELSRKTGLGLVWTVKQAQLYAIMAKLEGRGFVVAETLVLGNRPARRVFHLTEEGLAAYGEWLVAPVGRRDFRLDFLAKLHFAQKGGPRVAAALLAKQRALCAEWIAGMEDRARASEDRGLDVLVYRYRLGQLKAMLVWLDECKEHFTAETSETTI